MRTLYISSRKAVIKKDTSIKLTRVNPFTDAQGDYTFDIELPLHGCPQNVAIFGAAHRAETSKRTYVGRRYPAQLIAPPISLRGHVTVTQATETLIKAQFLSGYSDLANAFTDAEGKDIYIDQLDGLGFAWEEECPWYFEGKKETDKLPTPAAFVYAVNNYYSDKTNHEDLDPDRSIRLAIFAGTRDKTSCVAFPIQSVTESKKYYNANNLSYWECGISEDTTDLLFPEDNNLTKRLPLFDVSQSGSVAPQPYISYIIKRIVRSLGFELGENELAGSWLDNIFLANPRQTLLIKDMLPHMTAQEFFEEIAQFLGIYFDVVDGKVVMRRNRLRTDTVRIVQPVAEFTDEIEDEETEGKTALTQNVRYDFKDKFSPDKQLAVPEEVYEKSVVRLYLGEEDEGDGFGPSIYEYIKGSAEDLNEDETNVITIDAQSGAWKAKIKNADGYLNELEIDQLGTLVRSWNDPKKSVKLKVLPAMVAKATFSHSYKAKRESTDFELPNETMTCTNSEEYPALLVPHIPTYSESFEIWKSVKGESQEDPDTLDRIYIALNTGKNFHYVHAKPVKYHPVAIGADYVKEINRQRQKPVINEDYDYADRIKEDYFFPWPIYFTKDKEGDRLEHCPFALRETRFPSIAADAWQGIDIKTAVEHTVQFADIAAALDPTATYLISGRRFICHKLEIEITDRGIAPLKTGYFYELTE
jgi:hypothetical protein